MKSIAQLIAEELNVRVPQVDAAIALLDDQATVPFIARYRKEATGGLDDTQLRALDERLTYLRDLDDRRAAILKSIEEQGKLTPELAAAIRDAATKARLEDLYLPYKVKRRTKAQIAREAGLEPLALALWRDPAMTPETVAAGYVDADKGVADAAAALEGARWILMETFAEDAELVGGLRTLQQAAGFLRVMNGDHPLDASAVHPEAYPLVERIATQTGLAIGELIGKSPLIRTLKPEDFAYAQYGVPTVKDVLAELDKPNRDPRPEFKTAAFKDGVQDLRDLVPGMTLEGVVTNVANFGAFVDIGVHQDGLVHVSQLADRFVKDPREVVKAGDIVKVRVVEVDTGRKRIALTMKRGSSTPVPSPRVQPQGSNPQGATAKFQPKPAASPNTAFGAAFAKLKQ